MVRALKLAVGRVRGGSLPNALEPLLVASAVLLVACQSTSTPPGTAPSTSGPPGTVSTAAAPPPATGATSPATSGPAAAAASRWAYAFDADTAGGPPPGFSFGRTGEGKPGVWAVRAEPDAPSGPNVLAQTLADTTDDRFPIAVAPTPALQDVRVSVRCKPVAGAVDRACGVVFRYQDEKNYLLTRANALEANVRLYFVKDGRRQQIASHNGPVTSGAWHSLAAEIRGKHIVVTWDGAKILEADDDTFPGPGRAGVWTKADSVTLFDDLVVERL